MTSNKIFLVMDIAVECGEKFGLKPTRFLCQSILYYDSSATLHFFKVLTSKLMQSATRLEKFWPLFAMVKV